MRRRARVCIICCRTCCIALLLCTSLVSILADVVRCWRFGLRASLTRSIRAFRGFSFLCFASLRSFDTPATDDSCADVLLSCSSSLLLSSLVSSSLVSSSPSLLVLSSLLCARCALASCFSISLCSASSSAAACIAEASLRKTYVAVVILQSWSCLGILIAFCAVLLTTSVDGNHAICQLHHPLSPHVQSGCDNCLSPLW